MHTEFCELAVNYLNDGSRDVINFLHIHFECETDKAIMMWSVQLIRSDVDVFASFNVHGDTLDGLLLHDLVGFFYCKTV